MKGHVNSSGFPLQIGIGNLVNDTTDRHGWRTLYTEHAWKHPSTGEEGFIDLVLQHHSGTQYMVVECKRVKDTSWIFINENSRAKSRRHAKAFIFFKPGDEVRRFGWVDLTMEPTSAESQYCVIPGTDPKSKSLIERAASEIISSTESLAAEDKALSLNDRDDLHIYFNVLVTTATLQVCRFNSSDISIADGTIENCEFEEVPFVRLRKQLSTSVQVPEILRVVGSEARVKAKENTVFVVNSNYLIQFLTNCEIDETHHNERYWR
ncbi:MAG: hypothetical protein Q7U82_16955 [Gammaproteobacteria bacterium]|nr:hypothetical protein [Gammaproteobacteria bacterium]